MQRRMNVAIKFRESFRPFAPAVMEGYQSEYFELTAGSPYMLLVAPVRPDKRVEANLEEGAVSGLARLKLPRSGIPAVTHVDYSARVQTVSAARSPRFHAILTAFARRTGCPRWSTRALTSAVSPSSIPRRRLPLFHVHGHGCSRGGRLPDAERSTAPDAGCSGISRSVFGARLSVGASLEALEVLRPKAQRKLTAQSET